jgi:hypothetical protein
MSESIILRDAPLRLARPRKCDRDVKLHIPEALYGDLTQLARADSRTVGEYMRVVLERHTYGALGAYPG